METESKLVEYLSSMGIEQTHPGEIEPLETLLKGASPGPPEVPLGNKEASALYFTSGTTGNPKPVLLTHASIMCTALSEATNHQIRHKDRLEKILAVAKQPQPTPVRSLSRSIWWLRPLP
jgi:acyl-coenzyme A synthetase/AMP-(fatty) acid ligase